MRDAEPVARLARCDDRLRGAARALRARPSRIEPQTERHADRVRQRAQQRDGAVDAAAHRDGGASRRTLRAEDGTERVRERVDGERLAGHCCGLEQRQSGEGPVEPGRIRLDDAVAVDDDANRGPLGVASRVSEALRHEKLGPDLGNLSKQVGTLPPRRRTRVPFMVLLVHHSARTQDTA